MILTKTVIIKWNRRNKKLYEEKGYNFTKYNDEFEVKIEDLTKSIKNIEVKVQCDNCGKILKSIEWRTYLKYVKEDGKYYCLQCSSKLYGNKNSLKTRLKNSKSFEQWCINNNKQSVLDRWDYKLNSKKPSEIGFGSGKKYYFKCSRGIHRSELKSINKFTTGNDNIMNCKTCNSFAQWGIDNIGEDFLEKYWDYDKNTIDPWKISCGSVRRYFYIKCQDKNYHESYKTNAYDFIKGSRCPYCTNRNGKIHPLDSLGKLLEDKNLLHIWSGKNKKSPYKYAPMSNKNAYWKCPEGIHKDYPRKINKSNTYNFRCPECQHSKGEERIEKYLINNNIKVITQKKFNDLIGIGGGLLSYDFYLPNYNILIEYQGEFHDGSVPYQTEEQFKYQQEHDRRKKEYAQNNNIRLLEIWYWDYDKVEKILDKEVLEV